MKKDDKFNAESVKQITFHNLLKDERIKSIYDDLQELIIDKASEGAECIFYIGEDKDLTYKLQDIFRLLGFNTILAEDIDKKEIRLTISW